MRHLLGGLLALVLVNGAAMAQTLTGEQARGDLALAREALSRLHPGYDRFASAKDLDALWARMADRAEGGRRVEDLYLDLSRVLAEIRCDHTKAEFSSEMVEARRTAPVYLPFRFILFFDEADALRMFVAEPGESGLARGDEILTIDGTPVSKRLAAILPYMPVDGYTDHVKPLELAGSSEFLGSGFDHFDPLLNDVPATLMLEVRREDGAKRTHKTRRIGFDAYRALPTGQPFRSNFSDPGVVRLSFPQDGVGVLAVDTFVNYRTPADPADIFDPLFRTLKERKTETLILDLRRNGGGSVDAQAALIARLLTESARTAHDVRVKTTNFEGLRDHLRTWDQRALNPPAEAFTRREDGWLSLKPEFGGASPAIKPHPLGFRGRLLILTSASNSSGVTTLLATMRQTHRATFVGEPTGGSQEGPTAGIIFFLDLPASGLVVRVPMQLTLHALDDAQYGKGFEPDVAAPLTLAAWREGRDPAMDAAFALAAKGP